MASRSASSLPWRELRSSASEMMPLLGCLADAIAAVRVSAESGLNGTRATEGALDDVLPLAFTPAGLAAGVPERVQEVALPPFLS
jgi:hypothetical protein